MKALFRLKSAFNQRSLASLAALIIIAPLACPKLVSAAGAQTSGPSALVFDIKSALQNQNSLSYQQILEKDPLTTDLQDYLVSYNSPLADYTDQLLSKDNWKTLLAISFVESNMGIHHYYFNSSGIGGQQYLRRYKNYGEWIDDMSQLLDSRYSGWTLDKMNCIYVQPCSKNWAYGSKKIFAELTDLETQAQTERLALTSTPQLAMETSPTNSIVK
jgi:hypothetical protein